MCRVVFVENRGKTAFWVEVARALIAEGHSVGWIVQNPAFTPSGPVGDVIFLGFPKASDMIEAPIPEAVSTDRGRQYFGAGSRHYTWYDQRISEVLDHLRPDVVVGEPTLMHELLTVAQCRHRDIPYLHPTMTRYPGGRFNILDGDTQNPVGGSKEIWDVARLAELAGAISEGRSLPSYMAKPSAMAARVRQFRRAQGQAQVTLGWLRGERFNTPSPACKMALQKELKQNLTTWSNLARVPQQGETPTILYPLQMQPEANIDVWGRPYSDQVALVRRMLAALPETGVVAVKANPKSKYEASAEMLALARKDRRVILLPLEYPMAQAQAVCTGAVTVSGTVGFEAVFGRGRCLSLRHPVLEQHLPEFHATSPEEAVARLLEDPQAGCGSAARGADLLAQLVRDSYAGTINEPTYDTNCLSSENITRVSAAFMQVLATLPQKADA
jgi:hypothetical protein